VAGEEWLFSEQPEQAIVVLDAVDGIVLRNRLVNEQPIERWKHFRKRD
jgi:hypothetical protein